MPGYRHKYDVFDTKKDKLILSDVNSGEIEKVIGLKRDKTSTYARKQYLFQKRYRITSKTIPTEEVKINRTKEVKRVMNEWDRVRLMVNPNARR